DSKMLTALQRDRLFAEISDQALCIGVGQASPVEIDRQNILQASLLAMRRAVENLVITPDHALIDGNQEVPRLCCPQQTIVKGDKRSFTIAAASIIAKVTRDRMMIEYHQQFPQYGFDKHKGYPSNAHRAAIREFGQCEIHRRSFKVTL
ncbi:ribonuclease HII, partial [bacterium]|nr:ribonuclease HII [bacterium]